MDILSGARRRLKTMAGNHGRVGNRPARSESGRNITAFLPILPIGTARSPVPEGLPAKAESRYLAHHIRGQGRHEPKGKPMKFLRTATIAAALLGLSLGSGLAADPLGTWRTEEGKATVRIAACGPALCGTIISLKEANDPDTGKPKTDKNNADAGLRNRPMIGVLIVLGMKPSGTANKWSGQVYNAEDGKTYSGSLTLQDANTIKLEGCILGGLVCKAATWTRAS
jgi:uncharacterized protein (DUF2147 family)